MEDLSNKRFCSLTVSDEYVRIRNNSGTKIKWKCVCDCGNTLWVFSDALKRRKSNYCDSCRPVGIRHDKLYHIYYGILQRCYNHNNPSYKKYGAKGIDVCEEWRQSYDSFKQWADKNGYKKHLTIDRIDSNKGYYPTNCRWITLNENSARANLGKHKNKTKLINSYAISPSGTSYRITNIYKFSQEHGLNYSSVSATLHGRRCNTYHGWKFYSNKTQNS